MLNKLHSYSLSVQKLDSWYKYGLDLSNEHESVHVLYVATKIF